MKIKKLLSVLLIVCILVSMVASSLITTYADENTEEFGLGALIDDMPAILDTDASGFPGYEDDSLPSSVDLSTSACFPSVGSQRGVNSCVAWATTYYQFGYQVAAMNGWNAKNDLTYKFSPKFIYNYLNNGENLGTYVPDAYEMLKVCGAVRYYEFVHTGDNATYEYRPWCTELDFLRNALRYRISDYQKFAFSSLAVNTPINSSNDTSLNHMKSLLDNGHVLVYNTDFGTWDFEHQLTSVYNTNHVGEKVCLKQVNNNNYWDGHAMAIVGYDDNIQYDLSGDGVIQDYEKGAFKVVNSHGISWGNDGFMWVMYDALNKVSNTSAQNDDNRCAIFYGYAYYAITVDEYPLDLVAEVTLTMTQRNQAQMELGLSSINSTVPQQEALTSLLYSGGKHNFSGNGTTVQTATFPFDFGTLVSHPTVWKNYYIKLTDKDESDSNSCTVIDKIEIIDSSGTVVVSDTQEKTISGTTGCYRYKIAMVGDVDNDGEVSTADVSQIQRHCASIITFSDEEFKVADVDGDGFVNTIDTSCVQRFLAEIDTVFENGMYVYID